MSRIWVFMLAIIVSMVSCSHDEPKPEENAKRTILVYMIATNSLGSNHRDQQDLEEMDQAVANGALNGCRLLVYRVANDDQDPTLFEIRLKKGKVEHVPLMTYGNAHGASVTPERMRQVVFDMKAEAPAKEYGLVLWSHGTGWARSLTTKASASSTLKDFGEDNGSTMSLTDLADGIPTGVFEWIYADVCYMACVEVAYELRNHCHYFVGYTTEIPAQGMPYDLTLPLLCNDRAGLAESCRATYEYYNAMSGQNRTFSGAVVDCTQMDALADVCHRIQQQGIELESTAGLQCYNLNSSHFFFDFLQYYQAICPDEMQGELLTIYNKVVIDKMSTTTIFNRILIDTNKFSGLSTYIKGASPGVNEQYYSELEWNKVVFPSR